MEKERLRRTIMASLAVIESSSDPIIVDEAGRIKQAVKELSALKETPEAQECMDTVRELDSSLVSKYGVPVARAIEFLLVAAVAAKLYFFG